MAQQKFKRITKKNILEVTKMGSFNAEVHDARLDDIAKEFQVSREAARQMVNKAIISFRRKAFEMGYEPDDFVDVVRAR